jgi:tryptophan synthase alpha chain
MGVTGARATVGDSAQRLVARARAVTSLPVCVGLGVSSRGQAAQVAGFADGVIVGSALVNTLGGPDPDAGLAALGALARELADGVREGQER